MATTAVIDESTIGAVLMRARRFRSDTLKLANEFDVKFYRRLCQSDFGLCEKTTKNRIVQLPEVLRIAYGEALLGAASYFGFAELWEDNPHLRQSEARYTALDYAHFFADTVPIHLYNFRMMLISPEATYAMTKKKEILDRFDKSFPDLDKARHAVAHQHDRNFGVRSGGGKRKLFDCPINDECLTANGKSYRNENGERFTFNFELGRLRDFWSEYAQFLSEECV